MKTRNLFFIPWLIFCLSLAGCGGGSGSDTSVAPGPSEPSTFSGAVADGYLRNVTVFADKNGNKKLDDDEKSLSTITGVGGKYTLPEEARKYPIIALIDENALDEDNLPEDERTKPTENLEPEKVEKAKVKKKFILSAPAGKPEFVSPITTLVQAKMEKEGSADADGVAEKLKQELGISKAGLFDDFVAAETEDASTKNELASLHRVSQVVAQTMGTVQQEAERQVEKAGGTQGDIEDNQEDLVEGVLSLVLDEVANIVTKVDEYEKTLDEYQQARDNGEDVAEPEFKPEDMSSSVVEEAGNSGSLDFGAVTRTVTEKLDTDGDGTPNAEDTDADDDGVADEQDAFPYDPNESSDADLDKVGDNSDNCKDSPNYLQADFDQDGQGDVCDPDDDGDNVADVEDAFPFDKDRSADSDFDGIDDGRDNCPGVKNYSQINTDGDQLGNACDQDDDNDGVADADDAFPLDASESVDTDGDKIGNNADTDDDGDNVADSDDAFPLDASESVDTDGDQIGNNADTDDDGDNVADSDDAFPLDASESVDTDGDKIGNNADTDDDGDNVADSDDAFPLDASESVDTDGDQIGNNADTDDDGDNVADSDDAFPLDASESVDTDGDLIGNNADTDDDGDGMTDEYELAKGLDPLDGSDGALDADNDGVSNADEFANGTDCTDADTDDDGYNDFEDDYPLDADRYSSSLAKNLEDGRAALEEFETTDLNQSLLNAAANFEVANDLAEGEGSNEADIARFFYALTRVAKVAFDTQSDGDPSDLNHFSDFLDRLNVADDFTTRSSYNHIRLPESPLCAEYTVDGLGCTVYPCAQDDGAGNCLVYECQWDPVIGDCIAPVYQTDPLASGDLSSAQVLGFVESELGGSQGALQDALSALALISADFNDIYTRTDYQWDGYAEVPVTENTELDYSDVLFVKGIAQGLLAQINILQAHDLKVILADLDADIREADDAVVACQELNGEGADCSNAEYNYRQFLDANPNFFKLQAAERLAEAKEQVRGGLQDARAAIVAIQNETDDQQDDLVSFYATDHMGYPISPEEMTAEIAEALADIDEALTVLEAADAGATYALTDDRGTADTSDDKVIEIDPAAFFGGMVDISALLPVQGANGDYFPDTTLGGLVPAGLPELEEDRDGNGVPDLLEDPNFHDGLIVNQRFGTWNGYGWDGLEKYYTFAGEGTGFGTFTVDLRDCSNQGVPCLDSTHTGAWSIDGQGNLVLDYDSANGYFPAQEIIHLDHVWEDSDDSGFECRVDQFDAAGAKTGGWSGGFYHIGLKYAYLQYRNYEDATQNRTQGWFSINGSERALSETEMVSKSLTVDTGSDLSGATFQLFVDHYRVFDCRNSESCAEYYGNDFGYAVKNLPDPLPAGNYAYDVVTDYGDTLSSVFAYPGKSVIPYVSSATMATQWLSDGSLELSWENPATDPAWGEVDQLRIYLSDPNAWNTIMVKLDPVDQTVILPGWLLSQENYQLYSETLTWHIQTRAYDEKQVNYARGYSKTVSVSGRAFPYAWLQYRTYADPGLNASQGGFRLQIGLPEGTVVEDVVTVALLDINGTEIVPATAGFGVWSGTTYYTNCLSGPCTTSGPTFSSEVYLANIAPIAPGEYFGEVTLNDGSVLSQQIHYDGQMEMPVFDSQSMHSEVWSNGDLYFSWLNPVEHYNWYEVDQTRIYLFDANDNLISMVKLDPNVTDFILPASLVADLSLIGDTSSLSWQLQPRAFDAFGNNMSRSYSEKVLVGGGSPNPTVMLAVGEAIDFESGIVDLAPFTGSDIFYDGQTFQLVPEMGAGIIPVPPSPLEINDCPPAPYGPTGPVSATPGTFYCVSTLEGNVVKLEVQDLTPTEVNFQSRFFEMTAP